MGCGLRAAYAKDGGAFPDPIVKLSWPYKQSTNPSPEELAVEYDGRALSDLTDPKDPSKVLRNRKRGQCTGPSVAMRLFQSLRGIDHAATASLVTQRDSAI